MLKKAIDKWKGMPLQLKSSVAYTVCNVLQKSLSFITLPLFTRLLTTTQYGQYSVYTSWSAIFTIFITLNLVDGSFPVAMVRFEDDRKAYVAAVRNVGLVLALIFLAIYLPFRNVLNPILELPTALVILMVVEIVTHLCLASWFRIKQFEYRYKQVIAMTLGVSVMMPVLAYLMVINSEEKGYARILGYALVTIVVGAVLFFMGLIQGKGGLKKEHWKYAVKFNIPLIPYFLSQVIFNQSDRIMISHYSGTDKAGIYNVAYNLSMLLMFVFYAIESSYIPWFYEKIKAGEEKENRNISTGFSALFAFMLMGVIALAPEIIGIMAGPAYMEAIWVVPPITVSLLMFFFTRLFANVEFYFEEKSMLVWASAGSAILNVILNALLIPKFGFVAAGYTTLASYLVLALANYVAMKRMLKHHTFDMQAFDLKALVAIALGLVVLSGAAMALYPYPIARFAIIGLVFLVLGIWHKRVIAFVTKLLKRS